MIFRHSIIVFVTLLIGGIVNFGSISIFSRLLSPLEYGAFSLATATVALVIAFLFQWILHGFMRFIPQKSAENNKIYLTNFLTILASVSVGVLLLVAVFYALNQIIGQVSLRSISVWVWVLVPAIAIFETIFNVMSHYTRLVRENIYLFALATICRSFLYIGLGYFLIQAGYSYIGLLIALMLSFLLPSIILWFCNADRRTLSSKDVQLSLIHI